MEPDESLDRLLKRTLQPGQDARAPEVCLDADVLAAWIDGGLTPHERAAAEAHAAACDRCLSMLATMARVSPPPQTRTKARWMSLRWLVPLASAAAALIAVVLVQNLSQPSPSAPSMAPAGQTASADRVQPLETRPDAAASADRSATSQTEASRKPAGAPAASRQEAVVPPPVMEPARADSAPADAKAGASLEKRTAISDAAVGPPPATALPGPQAASAIPAPPQAPARQAETDRFDTVSERVGSVARLRASPSPLVVVSPDGTRRWRASGPQVERSTDGGRTWSRQFIAPPAALVAGVSPAPDVCWLVGRGGLVLLSADGESWRRLQVPDSTLDFVDVAASDAATATITAADGRRFHTTDGGRTWTPQENLPAPF